MLGSIVRYISNEFVVLLGWKYPDYRTSVKSCIKNAIHMRDLHQFLCVIDYVDLDVSDNPVQKRIVCCPAVYDNNLFHGHESDDEDVAVDLTTKIITKEVVYEEARNRASMLYRPCEPILPTTLRAELLQLCVRLNYLEPMNYLLPDNVALLASWFQLLDAPGSGSEISSYLPILHILVDKYKQIVISGNVINEEVLKSIAPKSQPKSIDDIFRNRCCTINGAEPLTPEHAKMTYKFIIENYDKPTQLPLSDIAIEVINAGIDIDINILRHLTENTMIRFTRTNILGDYILALDGQVNDPLRAVQNCLHADNKVNITIITLARHKLNFDQIVEVLSDRMLNRTCVQLITDTLNSYQQFALLERLSGKSYWNSLQLLEIMLTLTKIDKSVLESRINKELGYLADYIEVKLK